MGLSHEMSNTVEYLAGLKWRNSKKGFKKYSRLLSSFKLLYVGYIQQKSPAYFDAKVQCNKASVTYF